MSLILQIKTIIVSILFGIYFSFFLSINYKIIYHKKEIIKIFFTPILVLLNALLYFYLIQKINNGIFHIYEILCIIVGCILEILFSKLIANKIKK